MPVALIARRIADDWHHKYGHCLALLETFVEQPRFAGTCYRAANWLRVGTTTGRTRNDRDNTICQPLKTVMVYPLRPDFQRYLKEE